MAETITAEQAAKRLGITVRTLWRWREAGKIAEAPRVGHYAMFYAADVDRILYETKGIPTVAELDVADVYKRLVEADSWEDIDALKADLAAAICARAEDKAPLEKSYKAACSMAATHPDEEARGRWTRTAKRHGAWLGITEAETESRIARRESSPYVTYASAKGELEAAPRDPAYAIAADSCE